MSFAIRGAGGEQDVARALAAVEAADASRAGASFAARAAALEYLEIHVLPRLPDADALPSAARALAIRARCLHVQLEAANERVTRRLRERVRSSRYTPNGLLRAFRRLLAQLPGDESYDALDLLVAGLLSSVEPADASTALEPDMVAYQPTPARAILALIAHAQIRSDDVVFDLGSGLGHVVLLVTLLTGARTVGVELEPAYTEYAVRCARELGLSNVEVVQADAREASLARGTLFFMYTPFRGGLLQAVLERLRAEASQRRIRVCTYGPCTAEVARAGWLRRVHGGGRDADEVCVFHSSP